MDKKTRVEKTLSGGVADRPPVCFWHHFGPVTPEETVRGHIRFFEETDVDILKMMCDEFFIYPIPEDIKKASDWARLRPQGKGSHYVRGQVERATQINDALKGRAFSVYNAFSPLSTLRHAIEDQRLMADLAEDEVAVCHALQVIGEDTVHIVEGILRESGTKGMFLPLQGAETNRFTPEAYLRIARPSELMVIQAAEALSDCNFLHMCGWDGVPNQLSLWENYPARVVSWAVFTEKLSPADARTRFPERVLMGGFDNRKEGLLYSGTEAEIKEYTRQLLQETGAEGLILSADCSLPETIAYKRIRWVIEALETA